jgi:hypothetical protein
MTGSAFDGEVVNAARRANDVLKAAVLTWEQVLEDRAEVATAACRQLIAENDALRERLARLKVEIAFAPARWSEPRTTAEKIDTAVAYTEWLNGWEREFLCNIAGWRGSLTSKQADRLDAVITKLRRIARARGLAA